MEETRGISPFPRDGTHNHTLDDECMLATQPLLSAPHRNQADILRIQGTRGHAA